MKWFHLITTFALGLAFSISATAQELYRYRDENGVMHMEPTIPAQYVNQGYDVLSSQGMLIRRVPALQVTNSNEVEVQASDNILLSSYSSVTEITDHRDRRLSGIQRQIEIILSDRRVITGELDKEIRSASAYRADGNLVPAEISDRITELDGMVSRLDQQMTQRAEEKQAITDEFAAMIERFQTLKPQE